MGHFADNMGAVGWELTEEQQGRLTEVSERPLPYPYGIVTADAERA
jgi:hypothetical protein